MQNILLFTWCQKDLEATDLGKVVPLHFIDSI